MSMLVMPQLRGWLDYIGDIPGWHATTHGHPAVFTRYAMTHKQIIVCPERYPYRCTYGRESEKGIWICEEHCVPYLDWTLEERKAHLSLMALRTATIFEPSN